MLSSKPTRRDTLLNIAGVAGLGTILSGCSNTSETVAPVPKPFMARFPEKADMILLTDRPPQLETPLRYFRKDLTPNEAFFVRWHLADIPTEVNPATFRLQVDGEVNKPLQLSLDDVRKKFEPASVVAVNQCSGNSRSFFEPRVAGGQWRNGGMGNAKWTGARLKDVLDAAGVKAGAVEVSFDGLDKAVAPETPDFVKSLALDHARDGEVLIAYEMNGQPLPMLNGFPMRIVVPGWYATYWVKALSHIAVLSKPLDNFWMKKAYRIPDNPEGNEDPEHLAAKTVPINKLSVRSLFVRPEPSEQIVSGKPYEVEGLAMDYGAGIQKVEISTDDGKSWTAAPLDSDLGRYSWRRWRYRWTPEKAGVHKLQVRATNGEGRGQSKELWNRSGYMRNVIEEVEVLAV